MRKADFGTNHIEFVTWVKTYGDFLYRLLEAKRVIRTKFEKLEILEAFVLRFAVRWEVLVVQDMVTSLNRNASAYAKTLNLRLRKHLSVDECKAILYGHRYLNFRGVDDIKIFAKRYLHSSHNPFQAISNADAKKIDEFLIMRNLLAHYSDLAWRSYNSFIKNRYRYKRVPEPGEFLMGCTRKGEYRWSEYFRAFGKASYDMMRHVTQKTPKKSLQPTRHAVPRN
jgi:hypothetical protein